MEQPKLHEGTRDEIKECLRILTLWDDHEFKDGYPGHKVGQMNPMLKTKKLLNFLLKNHCEE